MKSLGERVREFRTHPSRNWTTKELAQRVGTSRQNIENLENGTVGIPRTYLAALAKVMGTTTDYLVGSDSPAVPLAKEREVSYSLAGGAAASDPLDQALATLGRALAASSPEVRQALATNMSQWALEAGAAHYNAVISTLLRSGGASGKRRLAG